MKTVQSIDRLVLSAVLLALTSAAQAQEPPKKEPDKWWEKSSLSYSPRLPGWLTHSQGTLSFMNQKGNAEGTTFSTDAEFDIRKSRFTNRFTFDLNKSDVVYTGGAGNVDMTENTLRSHSEYDLTARTLVAGGAEHYKNTLRFIDDRVTFYGGFGATLVQSKQHNVAVIAGFGYVKTDFDQQDILNVNPDALSILPTLNPTSFGAMVTQRWHWTIHRGISLTQNGQVMDYFNSDLGSKWSLGVELALPLAASNWAAVTLGYEITHEENVYTDLLGVRPQDRNFRVGFRISH